MSNSAISITLIGAGRLGAHLARRLFDCGFAIHQVFSRQQTEAEKVAGQVKAKAVWSLEDLRAGADLYILAVPDDVIPMAAEAIRNNLGSGMLVVHTSGATPGTVLSSFFHRYGIFYPLQSFSREATPDFQEIPLIIDARYEEDLEQLKKIGSQIAKGPYQLNDEQRKHLHLSAVFANNFTNHLLEIAFRILENKQISKELIEPLIEETFRKLKNQRPGNVQTGPAIRGDQETIDRHLHLLKETHPEWEDLYKLITKSIQGLSG
jgi:predicted short-subunit dehydrogenase-like oxidoreductase (DUF2520 family)